MPRELTTQVLIVGGGTGGVAAALACGSRGITCIVTEPTEWIGGQLTSQAVPPDENQWVETVGATRRYQHFREMVRAWYREHRSLTNEARAQTHFNPGSGWVSRLCFEPRIGHAVLREMLRPLIESGTVTVMTSCTPRSATTASDRVTSVTLDGPEGPVTISAPIILDATELGDLYPLAGIEHSIGAEGRATFGELHGRDGPDDPTDQQAFSWCFAITHEPGANFVIPKPAAYDEWARYTPEMKPAWCGPLFSWLVPSHNDAGCRTLRLVPWPDEPDDKEWELWRYRRIVDANHYIPGSQHPPDLCLVNWVQMDYWRRPLLGVSEAQRQLAYREAREQSRCLLYWMQTAAPRHDGGTGYPGLALRGEELGTRDGFAMAPYIREPRRLIARTIVHEGHIGTEQRRAENRPYMDEAPFGRSEPFADSVGIGHYTLDLHPSTAGRNSVYVPAAPFRIPMGSLIPTRCRNLLAAGKGIGVTHITNGCYRMHAVEWNIGEAAGALAAWCIAHKREAAEIHESAELIEEFQRDLAADGVRIAWPWEI